METYRIKRKNAVPLSSAIREYLREAHLTTGLNTRRIFATWDEVSGAAPYTLRRYYRGGTLYITLSSAVIRSRLIPRRQEFIDKINLRLAQDPLFTQGDRIVGMVQNLILK